MRAFADELAARKLRLPRLPGLPATRFACAILEAEFIRRADEDLDEEVAGDYFAVVRTVRNYLDWRDQHLASAAKLN
jgi:hypothetical protein